jgi:hypothetical protein
MKVTTFLMATGGTAGAFVGNAIAESWTRGMTYTLIVTAVLVGGLVVLAYRRWPGPQPIGIGGVDPMSRALTLQDEGRILDNARKFNQLMSVAGPQSQASYGGPALPGRVAVRDDWAENLR